MIEEPRCASRRCKHFTGVYQPHGDESVELPCCKAFPKGIPDDIAYGDNDHTSPVKGDHGIQFEPEGNAEEDDDEDAGAVDSEEASLFDRLAELAGVERVDVNGKQVIVYVDPIATKLVQVCAGSRHKEIRGLGDFEAGTLYFWDSYDCDHTFMAHKLGLDEDTNLTMNGSIHQGKTCISLYSEELKPVDFIKSRTLISLFGSGKVFVSVPTPELHAQPVDWKTYVSMVEASPSKGRKWDQEAKASLTDRLAALADFDPHEKRDKTGEWTKGGAKGKAKEPKKGSKGFQKLVAHLSAINKANSTSFVAFHYTTMAAAKNIARLGLLKNKMNGIYLVTKPSKYGEEWGNVMVSCRINFHDLLDLDAKEDGGIVYATNMFGFEQAKNLKVKVVGIQQQKEAASIFDRLAEMAATKKPTQSKLPDAHFGKVGKPLDWRKHKVVDERPGIIKPKSDDDEDSDEEASLFNRLTALAKFDEKVHPRGQPENKGEFAPKAGPKTEPGVGHNGGPPMDTPPADHQNRHKRRTDDATNVESIKPITVPQGMVPAPESRDSWPDHIKALTLPPTWKHVHINPDPDANLLAVGQDSKARTQYVYSMKFRESQAAIKFARIKELDEKFDDIAEKNTKDCRSKDARLREHAECARLIMVMGVRPGSDNDTGAEVQAYGATTLQGQHVTTVDGVLHLHFVGKKSVEITLPIHDPELADMLRERAKKTGPSGQLFPEVSDKSLLEYVHGLGPFKTKDFRTRLGTKIARDTVSSMKVPTNMREYEKSVREVARHVASNLGNTAAVALSAYISPVVWAPWEGAKSIPVASKKPVREAAGLCARLNILLALTE